MSTESFESVLEDEYVPQLPEDELRSQYNNNKIIKIMKKFILSCNHKVAISLSGGVDSMVITYALHLIRRFEDPHLEIYALHVNYNNREESVIEHDFLKKWCSDLGTVRFYDMNVDDMRRETYPDRNEYEKILKERRFNFYLSILKAHDISGIMLGHHKGDVFENVCSNIFKGKDMFNLKKMSMYSEMLGVQLQRPLVGIYKNIIYDFSKIFRVPYFKDTTPKWSVRGRFRNNLLAHLTDIYGRGCRDVAIQQATHLEEIGRYIMETELKPIFDTWESNKLIIKNNNVDKFTFLHWRSIFNFAFHKIGVPTISNKSIKSFILKIPCGTFKFQCSKNIQLYTVSTIESGIKITTLSFIGA